MPVRIWGVSHLFPNEKFKPLCELVEKYDLEIIENWSPKREEQPPIQYEIINDEKINEKENAKEIITTIKTPKGDLVQIYKQKLDGSPGMVIKHFIKDINDAEKFLSLPNSIEFPKIDSYFEFEKVVGERAMILIDIPEAMYSVHRYLGSETFGFWLYDQKELLHKMIEKSFKKIESLVKYYLSKKIGDGFGYYGPELCIPPLASVNDFKEFVFEYDKKIIDLIHNEGKLVWVHCHGDMAPVIEEFIKMGVDCLNPIEPFPVSKITLKQAKKICKGKMCLDGGIEDGAFDTLKPEKIEEIVIKTIQEEKPGGGFILCPTSTPNTWPKLLPRHIENYKRFVETAVKLRNYSSRGRSSFIRINTKNAPAAIGPYSQGIKYGDFIFVSGQIPVDPLTNKAVKGKIEIQTKQVIENIKAILKEIGADLENVIKTTVYLKNMKDFEKMNFVYAQYFKNKPARATIEVSNLPKGVLIEIEAIAVIEK